MTMCSELAVTTLSDVTAHCLQSTVPFGVFVGWTAKALLISHLWRSFITQFCYGQNLIFTVSKVPNYHICYWIWIVKSFDVVSETVRHAVVVQTEMTMSCPFAFPTCDGDQVIYVNNLNVWWNPLKSWMEGNFYNRTRVGASGFWLFGNFGKLFRVISSLSPCLEGLTS